MISCWYFRNQNVNQIIRHMQQDFSAETEQTICFIYFLSTKFVILLPLCHCPQPLHDLETYQKRVLFSVDRKSQIINEICDVCPRGPAYLHGMPNFRVQPGWLTGGAPESGDAGDPTMVLHRKPYKLCKRFGVQNLQQHTR